MILPIRKIGDPILEKSCREVDLKKLEPETSRSFWWPGGYQTSVLPSPLVTLIENMIETARAHNAVGLAANQVGENLRIFVFQERGDSSSKTEWKVAINPKIISQMPDAWRTDDFGTEGCLSIPKMQFLIPRAKRIDVEYFDERGNKVDRSFDGLAARVFTHEFDHLNGILPAERAFKIEYVK